MLRSIRKSWWNKISTQLINIQNIYLFYRKCFKTYWIWHLSQTLKYKEKRKMFQKKKKDQLFSGTREQVWFPHITSIVLVRFYMIYKGMVGVGLLSNVCIHVIVEHSSSPYYSKSTPWPPLLGVFMPGPVFQALCDNLPEHPGNSSPILHAVDLCPCDLYGMPVPLDANTCASFSAHAGSSMQETNDNAV